MLKFIRTGLDRLLRNETGQDAFEYLLVVGVIMVAIVSAIAAGGPGPTTAIWTALQTALTTAI